LVPSSLVGHAAIYLGLRGPVFSVAELGLSGEAAFLAACELVEAGEVSAMVAASVEERSVLAEGVLGPVCSDSNHWTGARVEGSSAVIVEDESHARERGVRPLARVISFGEGRGPFHAVNLPHPLGEGASVIVPRRDAATNRALAATSWNHARCIELAPRTGNHEGLGGWALACGAALVASGEASEVLVLGIASDRFSTVVLVRA
jgi:3-oxoacyl-[acyl-carrier-protein] synthase II